MRVPQHFVIAEDGAPATNEDLCCADLTCKFACGMQFANYGCTTATYDLIEAYDSRPAKPDLRA